MILITEDNLSFDFSYCLMMVELEEQLLQVKKEIAERQDELKQLTNYVENSANSINFIDK